MKSIMKRKRLLGLATIVLLIFGTYGVLQATNQKYNRPWPLMDYVPQEIGIYDTTYENLTESDCRGCHGNSLADRHHATTTVVRDHRCVTCHEVDPGSPSGVFVTRDCLTSGCHSKQDLQENGWHHNTDVSGSGDCVTCHNPSLIAPISPIRDFSLYPPSVVTPTPFSCENCHWEQACSTTGNPDAPGHPSTYNHVNENGEIMGFHEYEKSILSNSDTHHMGFLGNVSTECYQCHSQNPGSSSWDPFNPQLIRYCEICHSISTLHRIEPHVKNTNGWAAVGFHVPSGNEDTEDYDPVRYKTWDTVGPYAPEEERGFTADQQCFGCHGDKVPQLPSILPSPPVIDDSSAGIRPSHGCCGVIVTLRGTCFGEDKAKGYKVRLSKGTDWLDMPVRAWADTLIEFEVPCWTVIEPGNYKVRVVTPAGASNIRVFTLENGCQIFSNITIGPDIGPCGTWIKVSLSDPGVGSFGNARSEMFDDSHHGVYRVVDFSSSQGTYTALDYRNWSEDSFEVRFYDFFKDSLSPTTGQRDFVQEIDSEPTLAKGMGLALGKWVVSVKFIYFGDEDGNGTLSQGDVIFQVGSSDPLEFEISNSLVIYRITPSRIADNNLVSIYGLNFGTQSGGEVRVGSLEDAEDPALGKGTLQSNIKSWSNTLIKVKVSSPSSWAGEYKYLWVEKSKSKSNFVALGIIADSYLGSFANP